MTSLAKKIPAGVGLVLFGVAACTAMLKGAEVSTAVLRGLTAGFIGALLAFFPAYLIFSEPLPQPKTPQGLEHLEEQIKPKTGQ